jgi:hypothetical protein
VAKILLENLAVNQAFDKALKKNPGVDRIVSQFTDAILFTPDESRRSSAIAATESRLIDYFSTAVQPAARTIGIENARRVLKDLGPSPDLNDPKLRQTVLLDLQAREADRLRIIQAIVNDKANTLENRLSAYWLEPGSRDSDKLKQLRDLHAEMEQRRRDYDQKLEQFNAGKSEKPPRKPNLDFDSRFAEDVKTGFREQARRGGTDAETATFVSQGHQILAWITVNATDACPDCRVRQGARGDLAFWDRLGRPGSGKTICGSACFCMLVPEKTIDRNPHLERGLIVNVEPVLTSDGEVDVLRGSRT